MSDVASHENGPATSLKGRVVFETDRISQSEFRYALAGVSTFRDRDACERVRAITRTQITEHANPDFVIKVIDEKPDFYAAFAEDLVGRIAASANEGEQFVAILPLGPVPQYALAARLINEQRISMRHVHTFNMDEYADEDGNTAPIGWAGSFQGAMWRSFFHQIDPELRPPESQIHFPTTDLVGTYSDRIADLGGADVCYGGIGWAGHIAFWEPHLGAEFAGDLAAYRRAGARLVELHPMTVMQNALHSFGGDWSWVPPKANTIGPRDILGARHRSFWLDGDLGGGHSWQRFIARLVAHGPVSEWVPGSLLQETRTDYTMLGAVADDLEVSMA
jgi:glucosamine-6-phosphate deaminase